MDMLVVLDVKLTYCTSLDFLCVSIFSLAFRSDPAIILQTPWSANAITDISFDRSNYFYDYGMYYPKFTILALYFELFPNTMPKLRMSLYIATAFTVMCSFTTLGLVTFYCKNVSDNWSLEPGKCSSFNSLLVLQIDWAMNFSSDVASKSLVVCQLTSSPLTCAVFALPFPLLRVLRLRRRQRYGLLLTFTLGLVTIAVNLARFITVQIGSDWNNLYVWSMAEMSVAIIVVSMPALKYLLTSWRKLAGSGTESSSYYNSSAYDGQRSSRRHNQISCTLADETGSDVELNRVMREDVIVKTKEVSVDSRPAGGGGSYSFTNQSWEKETRSSGDESRPPR